MFFAYSLVESWKSILTNLKIPRTVFLFVHFSNIKKEYLRILKYLQRFFYLYPFFKGKKETYLRISKHLAQFFCSYPFQILKNGYLWISKYLAQFFCISHFQILKKAYLQISNYLAHTWHDIRKIILEKLKIPDKVISYPFFKY